MKLRKPNRTTVILKQTHHCLIPGGRVMRVYAFTPNQLFLAWIFNRVNSKCAAVSTLTLFFPQGQGIAGCHRAVLLQVWARVSTGASLQWTTAAAVVQLGSRSQPVTVSCPKSSFVLCKAVLRLLRELFLEVFVFSTFCRLVQFNSCVPVCTLRYQIYFTFDLEDFYCEEAKGNVVYFTELAELC